MKFSAYIKNSIILSTKLNSLTIFSVHERETRKALNFFQ